MEYYYGKSMEYYRIQCWNVFEYYGRPIPKYIPWCWNMMEYLPTFYPNNDPVLQVNMPAPCAMEHLNIFNGLVLLEKP